MAADKPYVLIDGTKLADANIDGIRRYLEELLKALSTRIASKRPDWSIRVTIDTQNMFPLNEVVDAIERSEQGTPLTILERRLNALRTPASAWGQKLARLRAKMERSILKRWPRWKRPQGDCGLIHLPLPNTFRLYAKHPAPMMVTVHDLSHLVCPQFQTPTNIATLAQGLECAIDRNASFLAVSESTRREMIQLMGVPERQIRVVHEASDPKRFVPMTSPRIADRLREKYKLPNEPFVLTLCRLEPRKNLMSVVRACQHVFQASPDLRFHLVIAGATGWGDQAAELGKLASSRIHLTGAVDDGDLAALYSNAAAFLCMSHYEGFSLPILEAMACGCPVIHSNTSAMPEIAGGAGLSAPPADVLRVASHINDVLRDPKLRRRLKEEGLQRSRQFSWARAADETLEMYDSLISVNEERSGIAA